MMIHKILILSCLIFKCIFVTAQVDTVYYDTGQVEAIGKYENSKKQGQWKWFYKNGHLMSIEHYENDKFKEGKFWNEKGESVTINEIIIHPRYPNNGLNGFEEFISKNLQYPAIAAEKNIQGKVIIDFNINSKGEPVDFKIFQSVFECLDNEAIRVIKESGEWIPGTFHGKNVKVSMRFPINFKL